MNQNQTSNNTESINNINKKPITSPISQRNLVSKVNALALNSANSSLVNPQSIVFNAEKGSTLNYKFIVDELVKLATVDNTSEFYNKVHSIIYS